MELKSLTPLLCIQDNVKEVMPLNFLKIMDEPADSPYFSSDDFRYVLKTIFFLRHQASKSVYIIILLAFIQQGKHPFKCR